MFLVLQMKITMLSHTVNCIFYVTKDSKSESSRVFEADEVIIKAC